MFLPLSIFFFRLISPHSFSAKIHAPCAHYKERNTQACIPIKLNLLLFMVFGFCCFTLLLKQDCVCIKKNRLIKCFSATHFFFLPLSSFPCSFFPHRLMCLALTIRRGIDKYAFLLF